MTLDLSLIVKVTFERLMSFNIFKLIKIPISLKKRIFTNFNHENPTAVYQDTNALSTWDGISFHIEKTSNIFER